MTNDERRMTKFAKDRIPNSAGASQGRITILGIRHSDFGVPSSLLLERPALDIGGDAAPDENEDSFDEAPDGADAQRAEGHGYLRNSYADVAEVKPVDPQPAEKDA